MRNHVKLEICSIVMNFSSGGFSVWVPESEEERRILPFVACGTLKTDKGKYRLSRL